jgi:UDP-N-acetylglucosamine 4,6-dehydratase/5-epimerase
MSETSYIKMWDDFAVKGAKKYLDTKYNLDNVVGLTGAAREHEIFRFLDLGENDRLLDVGCASGHQVFRSARVCKEAIGIDVGKNFIDYANGYKEKHHIKNVKFILTKGEIPFPDDSFDRLICSEVIEHVPDEHVFIEELKRVMKPGAIAVFTVPNWNSRGTLYKRFLNGFRPNPFTPLTDFSAEGIKTHGDAHVRQFYMFQFEVLAKVHDLDVLYAGGSSFIDFPKAGPIIERLNRFTLFQKLFFGLERLLAKIKPIRSLGRQIVLQVRKRDASMAESSISLEEVNGVAENITINMDSDLKNNLNNKTILVTGGTGSFGHAVVERLLRNFEPKEVVVLSRDEKKQLDMRNKFGTPKLRFIVGDVRDKDTVSDAMKDVDLVFHASALKQVPTCEFFPVEAVRTNVMGSHNVIKSAIDHDIERVVILSTDKAVNPINAMGMTKALMEKVMIAASREKKGKTVLCGTRYGNVMYTRGSVLPYFVELVKNGKPLTVTNKDMTRFMMPLEHSVDLVLYALAYGQDGEMFVRKAPSSTMGDISTALAEIFSHSPGVEEIGIRPGEKLHESLISREELFRAEDCGDYYKIMPESSHSTDYLNYYIKGDRKHSIPDEGYNSDNSKRLDLRETKDLILSLKEIREELANLGR